LIVGRINADGEPVQRYWNSAQYIEAPDDLCDWLLEQRRLAAGGGKETLKRLRALRLACGYFVSEPPKDCPYVRMDLWPTGLAAECDDVLATVWAWGAESPAVLTA
jgi:hypothetical protein